MIAAGCITSKNMCFESKAAVFTYQTNGRTDTERIFSTSIHHCTGIKTTQRIAAIGLQAFVPRQGRRKRGCFA